MISWIAGDNRINLAGQKRTSDAEKRGDIIHTAAGGGLIFVRTV
jgi:hypothetical protein